MNLNIYWARLTCWLWRFRDLTQAEAALAKVSKPLWLRRKMFGATLTVDVSGSATQMLLYLEGERLISERFLITKLLRRGMTVIDVGANVGYYLLMVEAEIGKDGIVILIEPSQENIPALEKNIAINGFQNVNLYPVAVGLKEGIAGLRSGLNSGIVENGSGAYEVQVKQLDALVDQKVDFLKIDVEGFEGQVLAGAKEIIKRDRPILFLEVHPHLLGRFGFDTDQIFDFLHKYYATVSVYETIRPEEQSLYSKIAFRYFQKDSVRKIEDVPAYIRRYGPGAEAHTFWVVCRTLEGAT